MERLYHIKWKYNDMTLIAQEMRGSKLSTPENNSTTILRRIGYNTCTKWENTIMPELLGSRNSKLEIDGEG